MCMKKYKKSYKNHKFKKSAPLWNEECELAGGSYSSSGIQDSYDYIIKKHETFTFNLQVRIYVNKTQNRITFQIKAVDLFELLTPEKMKTLGSTKSKTTNYKNGKKNASFRNY